MKIALRVLLVFAFLVSFAAGAEKTSSGQVDPAWRLLFENKFAEAEAEFQKQIDDKNLSDLKKLDALEGLYTCVSQAADTGRIWDVIVQQVEHSAAMPDGIGAFFFRRLNKAADVLGKESELAGISKKLMQGKADPDVSLAAKDSYQWWLMRQRKFKEVEKLIAGDGFIRLYAKMIGPFKNPLGYRTDIPYPPEENIALKEFPAPDGGTIKPFKNAKTGWGGSLSFSNLVFRGGMGGAMYLVAVVESDVDKDVILAANIGRGGKIWINRRPVFRGDAYRFEYHKSVRNVRVSLTKGANIFLIKDSRHASVQLRLLSPEGGVAEGVKTLGADSYTLKDSAVYSTKGFLFSVREQPRYLIAFEKMQKSPAVSLWLSAAYNENALVQERRGVLDHLLAQWPKSVSVLCEAGWQRMSESRKHIDSASRLNKEGMNLFDEALEVDGDCYPALVGKGIYYARHKQEERALEILRKAVGLYPGCPITRKELAKLYKEKSWTALAEEQYAELTKISGEFVVWQARFLDSIGRKAEANKLFKQAYERGFMHQWRYIGVLADSGRYKDADKLLSEYAMNHDAEARRVFNRKAALLRQMGDFPELVKQRKVLAEFDKDNPKSASEVAEIYLVIGDKENALKWMREAVSRSEENDKVDPDLRRRLRKLEGGDFPLLAYDIKLPADHAKVVRSDHPRANHAELLHVDVCRIYPDRSTERLIHRAVKVFDKNGIGGLSELPVPTDSDDLILCRTIQEDGTVYVPTSVENFELGKDMSMYKVTPGSVLEYSYRESSDGGRNSNFSDQYFAEFFNTPLIRGRYVLIVPEELNKDLSVECLPEDMDVEVKREGGEVVYIWDFENVEGRKPERFSGSHEKILSNVSVALRGPDEGSQRWRFSRQQPLRGNKEIDKLVELLTKDIESERDKVAAIYSWIAGNIKDAQGARTARDVLALRAGSSYARSRLCAAMLESIGIKTAFANANMLLADRSGVSREQRAKFLSSFGGVRLLHVILPEEADVWLRFYRPGRNYRMGDVGRGTVGAPALEAGPQGLSLVRVCSEIDESVHDINLTAEILEDASASVSGGILWHGAAAGYWRTRAEDPQQGALDMERISHWFFPKLQLQDQDYDEGGKKKGEEAKRLPETEPFAYRFNGNVKNFCRQENGDLVFAPLPRPTGANRHVAPLPRENPFCVDRDYINTQVITYLAPRGWAFSEVPMDCYRLSETGLFSIDFNVEGRRLTVSSFLVIPAGEIEAEAYTALHALCGDIEKIERMSVSISKLPGEGALLENITPVYEQGAVDLVDLNRYRYCRKPEAKKAGKDKGAK